MSTLATAADAPRPTPSRTPLAWVSWLRCIGVLGVVSIHVFGPLAQRPQAWHTSTGIASILLKSLFIWAVPVFVMLAGAFALDPARYRDAPTFYARRTRRLLPAVIAWNLVYSVLAWWWQPPGGQTPLVDLRRIFNGQVTGHLYFLLVVLGLSVVTPIMIRWVAQASRRELVGLGLFLGPIFPLTYVLSDPAGKAPAYPHNLLTWWFPFLGFYVLGWALRGVRLRGPALAAACLGVVVGLVPCVRYTGANPGVPVWSKPFLMGGYYSWGCLLASVGIYLAAQGLLAPDGVLRGLGRPAVLAPVDWVGRNSLGIYAFHLVLIWGMGQWHLLEPVYSFSMACLRWVVVVAISCVVVWLARKVPYLRELF